MAKRKKATRRSYPTFNFDATRKDIHVARKLLATIGQRVETELDRIQQVEDDFYEALDAGMTPVPPPYVNRHHGRRGALPQSFYDMQSSFEELLENFENAEAGVEVAEDNLSYAMKFTKAFADAGKPRARKPRKV